MKIYRPSTYTWNALISAHAKLGDADDAIALFYQMTAPEQEIEPNRVTFLTLLKVCRSAGALAEGMILHDLVNRSEHESDVLIMNTIIDMYAKCGLIMEAYDVFSKVPSKDSVSWSIMISGYVHLGLGVSALELFEKMFESGLHPCEITYLSVVKACGDIHAVGCGQQIHMHILSSGLESDINLASSLVYMYCKCCHLADARWVFHLMPERSVVSWSMIIGGYMQEGFNTTCLELFTQMQQEGISSDAILLSNILKVCSNLKALEKGRLIHEQVKMSELTTSDMELGVALIEFYGKCGSLDEAHRVFDEWPKGNVMLWVALIAAYADNGAEGSAVKLFDTMMQAGLSPNVPIFLSMLKVCGNTKATLRGRFMHDQILKFGYDIDQVLGTDIINMYVKWDHLKEAHSVFDNLPNRDIVSWSVIISGYVEHEDSVFATQLFEEMQEAGIAPDRVTILCMLKASSKVGSVMQGRMVHEKIIRTDLICDTMVGNSVVDMYVKCGSMDDAHNVFERLPVRTVISWSSLITGYVEHKQSYMALQLFEQMEQENVEPNEVTLLHLLKACCSIGIVDTGKMLHDRIMRDGFSVDEILGSAIIDMYGSCGELKEAASIFERLPCQDLVSWNAIISAYAQQGNYRCAFQCIQQMKTNCINPNSMIFASILSACCNAGLLREGWYYFNNMKSWCVRPCMEHYSCMVDLLSRTGYLKDALGIIDSMPFSPDAVVWTSLLSNCESHGSFDLGMHSFNRGVDEDRSDASLYDLMCRLSENALTVKLCR